MSQQDAESALGKPDRISIRNSPTSYRYDNQRDRSTGGVRREGMHERKSQIPDGKKPA
ncbi:hypothetical protein EMIT0P258_140112 [Pseudomonas sp. IT-P258]